MAPQIRIDEQQAGNPRGGPAFCVGGCGRGGEVEDPQAVDGAGVVGLGGGMVRGVGVGAAARVGMGAGDAR